MAARTEERAESCCRAAELVAELARANGAGVLHTDRGAAVTSEEVAQPLLDMGVQRSHSRPETSNDPPYSDVQFKTVKYTPGSPPQFDSPAHARAWMEGFMSFDNREHRHSWVGYHTPASAYFGTVGRVPDQQATVSDRANAAYPERFSRRP